MNWQLFAIGIIVLLAITYLLRSNFSSPAVSIVASPVAVVHPTIKPSPSPSVTPEPVPESIKKPIDSQPSTILERDLISAINDYRQSNGVSRLSVNEGLCQEARKRAQDLTNQNMGRWPPFILGHEPFLKDISDGTLGKLSGGLSFFGENVASSNCKNLIDGSDVFVHNANQLVEECFVSSEEHKENMLRSDWIYVCSSGRYPFYVQIFGK